ncbi:MAG: phage scaffolding protein [Clostridia bacterium]|nr:phage scaffolding protein [Clostridia bacterium]
MKREFLQNFKVGDQPLPDAIIQAILDEHGKGIEREKAKYVDYDTIKAQLETAKTTIQGYKELDIEGIKKSAADWELKYNTAVETHKQQMADLAFDGILKDAISEHNGRNATAIRALLNVDELKKSKNQAADIKSAIETLKKESGYLFEDAAGPSPYAPGPGTRSAGNQPTGFDAIRAAAGLKTKE